MSPEVEIIAEIQDQRNDNVWVREKKGPGMEVGCKSAYKEERRVGKPKHAKFSEWKREKALRSTDLSGISFTLLAGLISHKGFFDLLLAQFYWMLLFPFADLMRFYLWVYAENKYQEELHKWSPPIQKFIESETKICRGKNLYHFIEHKICFWQFSFKIICTACF